ncbi:MAG: glucose-1-phosphate thymidylyltransferase [Muribaculaceae bacterium]|nr:glucose-1-phosphate thymidylyltransferase [Muribaculaceae bacterium]
MKPSDIIVKDIPAVADDLLPLTYTRPVGAIRVGIDTIADKWQALLPGNYRWAPCRDYLCEKFPSDADPDAPGSLTVAGDVVPDAALAEAVAALGIGVTMVDSAGAFVAARGGVAVAEPVRYEAPLARIRHPYDIFLLAAEGISADFDRITGGRVSEPLSPTNTVIGDPSLVFLEPGAKVECAVLNVTAGPIYIGRDAEVMEGALMRGPVAVCSHAVVNMGTKIYGATVIGPWCKVGGELNNVVMQAYSNKAHDGFLGNAVIGEWCNLGAGCVASNLKNNYTQIKLWNYPARRFLPTGLQFCGLIMGDHSKAGINTMFNTATVIGVGVNVHQTGFPRAFVPSFSDGGSISGFNDVPLSVFFDTARRVMARRGIELTEADERMFTAIKDSADQFK